MKLRSFTASLLLLAAPAAAEDWPNWRGPNRDGVSAERDLPATWSAESNVLWKVPLPGAAGATPVIAKDRIYLTSPSADSTQLLLLCLGLDGKTLWERTLAKGLRDTKNLASASPSANGEHVWGYAGTGDLVCFTAEGVEV